MDIRFKKTGKFMIKFVVTLGFIIPGLSNIALAECKDTACTETNDFVNNLSSVKTVESVDKSVVGRCIVNSTKPLRLLPGHPFYEQIKQQYPTAMNSKRSIKVVLNENANPCEIMYVVLLPE